VTGGLPESGVETAPAPGPSGGFWGSALTYTIGALVLQGVNFVLTPVFTHVMTSAELGQSLNYLFWSTLFGILIGLQMQGTLNNVVTLYGRDRLTAFIRQVVPWYGAPTLALLVVLLVARHQWQQALGLPWEWLALAIGNGVCIAATLMAMSHAVVTGRRVRYLLITFLATVAGALVGLFLIGVMADDALARVLGYAAGSVMVVLLLVPDLLRERGRRVRGVGYLAFALPIAIPLLAHELLWFVASNANRVIVLRLESASAAGVFGFAASLGGIAALMAIAVNAAWTPWYFARTKSGATDATRSAARDLVLGFGLLMGIAILVSPEVLRLVSGREFWAGNSLVPVFIAVGTTTFVFNLGANYLIYLRRTGLVLMVSAAGCAMTLGLSVAVIRPWGPPAVAVVSYGAAAFMALSTLVIGHRLGCRNLPQWVLAAVVLGSGALLVVAALLYNLPMLRFLLALVLATILATSTTQKLRRHRRAD
jgi:O-antigen/teichoic acid export membrane protein